MALTSRLQSAAGSLLDRARGAGLPVDRAEAVFDERLRPLLLKLLSIHAIPFVRRSGVRVEALEPGRVVCRMPLKGNVNHIGTMYAGALFTLAEFPGGPLLLATFGLRKYVPIVTALDMAFDRAAKGNVRVELSMPPEEAQRIQRETDAHGKAEFELIGELRSCDDGEIVARSRATYQMRPRRRR